MDIPRNRRRPSGLSTTAPTQIGDPATARGFQEVQAAIDDIGNRISSTPEFDPSKLQATDADLARQLDALKVDTRNLIFAIQKAISDLALNFPIIRHAKVTGSQTGYVECTFWNPVAGTALGTVNVATQATHSVDDVILITQMFTGVTDGGGAPVGWQEVGGGGGGNGRMWIRDTYYLLTLIAEAVDGDFGYASTRDDLYVRRNGVWRIVSYFSATTASAPTVATNGVDVGDEWYDITTGQKSFWGDDAAWHCYTHFKDPD